MKVFVAFLNSAKKLSRDGTPQFFIPAYISFTDFLALFIAPPQPIF